LVEGFNEADGFAASQEVVVLLWTRKVSLDVVLWQPVEEIFDRNRGGPTP